MMDFLPDDDPRMQAAEKDIVGLLDHAVGHLPISRQALTIAHDALENYRTLFKRRYGVIYPKMVVLPLPSVRYLKVVRHDQTEEGMKNVIRNLWVEFPSLTADDIAKAVRMAWPHYRPPLPDKPPPRKPVLPQEVPDDAGDVQDVP